MPSIEERIQTIEERNARVEFNKAWETSWARRGLICAITYACAVALLFYLGDTGVWQHALVPVMGYILSTLSLPAAREIWLQHKSKRKA